MKAENFKESFLPFSILYFFFFGKNTTGATVLVIGGGASGKDIALQLSKTAQHVTSVQRRRYYETESYRKQRQSVYGEKVTFKNNVVYFTPTGAKFDDRTHEDFTHVIYATGDFYLFSFHSFVESNLIEWEVFNF